MDAILNNMVRPLYVVGINAILNYVHGPFNIGTKNGKILCTRTPK